MRGSRHTIAGLGTARIESGTAGAAQMRILIYAMNYAPEIVGAGRCTAEIGAHLAAQGHDVTVVTTPPHYPEWKLRAPYQAYSWYKEQIGRQTILRCPLHVREKMKGIWRLIAPLSFAVNSAPVVIWQVLRKRPDVVLCVEPTLMGAPALALAAKFTGATRVLHVQDLEVDAAFAVGHLARFSWLKSAAFAFERFCLNRFDRVITISDRMAERLERKGVKAARLEIVRNWVDLERVRPWRGANAYSRELGLAPGQHVVLYSGTLGAKMGFEVVLSAAALLVDRKDILFVIAGEGPAKGEIEAGARTLPNVRVLPFQPEERIGEFLGVADVHVLPQSAEAADLVLPSKLGGMLASGRPIVATAAKGTEIENFLGDAARLTPPGDTAALAAAILAAVDCGRGSEREVAQRVGLATKLSKSDGLQAFEAVLTQLRLPGVCKPSEDELEVTGASAP